MTRGRIEKALSGFYYVNTGAELLQCRARGRFRREGLSPLVGPATEECIVVFNLPEQYRLDANGSLEGTVKIEVLQDGRVIESAYINRTETSFSYTFRGSKGTTSTVKLYIGGVEAVVQEITF